MSEITLVVDNIKRPALTKAKLIGEISRLELKILHANIDPDDRRMLKALIGAAIIGLKTIEK